MYSCNDIVVFRGLVCYVVLLPYGDVVPSSGGGGGLNVEVVKVSLSIRGRSVGLGPEKFLQHGVVYIIGNMHAIEALKGTV